MKYFIILLGCVIPVFANLLDESLLTEWKLYKLAYNKSYATQEEDNMRLQTYLKTKKIVEEHNFRFMKGEVSFDMELNNFADWQPDEIQGLFGLELSKEELEEDEDFEDEMYNLTTVEKIPDSINWVNKGAVTSVKNQLQCGSCYAFSAVGALEGQTYLKTKKLVSLSVQNIVDCTGKYDNKGCNGGGMINSYKYVRDNHGIDTDESYPYVAKKNPHCRYSANNIGATCKSFKRVRSEKKLLHAVAKKGPVAVGIGVDYAFLHYHSGVYDSSECKSVRHAVLVVGYNKKPSGDDKHPYWLVKNSWGTRYGENGYIKMRMNKNLCHIGNHGSYPIV